MDDIFIKKCTEADMDILRRLLSKTFSETFAHMNTPENVKKAAKYVCPSNEEDGVLDVLEKMFAQTHPDNEK